MTLLIERAQDAALVEDTPHGWIEIVGGAAVATGHHARIQEVRHAAMEIAAALVAIVPASTRRGADLLVLHPRA